MSIFVTTQASKTIWYFLQDFLPNLVFWGFAYLWRGKLILFSVKANTKTYYFFPSAISALSFEHFLTLTPYNKISHGSNWLRLFNMGMFKALCKLTLFIKFLRDLDTIVEICWILRVILWWNFTQLWCY